MRIILKMNVHPEIQSVLSGYKVEVLLEQNAIEQGTVASPDDSRFRLQPNSRLLHRARILQCLWSDPQFWKTVSRSGDQAAMEYVSAAYELPLKPTIAVLNSLRCGLLELTSDYHERLRFFAGILHLCDDEVETASRNWMKQSGRRVLPILKRYLTGPRFASKRYLLRNLSHEDLAELHKLASELADDTEHVAMKERFDFFPDVIVQLRRGNRKSALYLEKTEWMVNRILEDLSLSDNALSKMYLVKFGESKATTKEDAKNRGWNSTSGSLRKIAAEARDLVEFRHQRIPERYIVEQNGKMIGLNPGNRFRKRKRSAR